jgi:hypothetical protein
MVLGGVQIDGRYFAGTASQQRQGSATAGAHYHDPRSVKRTERFDLQERILSHLGEEQSIDTGARKHGAIETIDTLRDWRRGSAGRERA